MQKIISCGGFRYNSNDFIEENGELKLKNSGGGGGNVLIINATIDREHAESETEFPLILDKTAEEIQAAESTVLHVDADGVMIVLQEFYVSPDRSMIQYQATIGGMEYQAGIGIEEGALVSFVTAHAARVLPSVTSSDNGKALKVANGAWVAMTDILVLHGTLTSATGGTITEAPGYLMDAIMTNKRIIFAVTMPTTDGTADYKVDCTVTKVENSKPHAYGTCSTEGSSLLAVYIGEVNDSLTFEVGQYTLTPYSP